MTSEAEQFFATDAFKSEWIQSGAAYREKHLLEGMVRTCDMGMEDDRIESDEVTLPYLQKANDRGFLTLLKHFILDDASPIPSEPIFIPSPRWDCMMGKNPKNLSNVEKAWQAYTEGIRNEFTCKPFGFYVVLSLALKDE
jgi:hypothetical protein